MPTPAPWQSRIVGHREVGPDDLVANPRNWRGHPPQQSQALGDVLAEVGWVQSVIRNVRTGRLIDGHLRVDMAKARGEATVPVVDVDLSEDEEALILATIDPIGAMAEANADRLADLMEGLEIQSEAVRAMLEDVAKNAQRDITEGLTDPDAVPEEPDEPLTESGDLWILGGHRLLCGDSTDAEDVERLMDGDQADCVFTDPPYGVGYDGGAKKRERLVGDQVGTTIYGDALPHLRHVAADHAALYLWYADAHAAAAAAAAAGYDITAQIIWVKNNAQFVTSAHYKGKHEPCFYAHRRGQVARWTGPNNEVTVWEEDRASRNEFHPTQKPTALAARAISNSTNAGDLVLDLFLGSGATMIAAEQIGRRCYGLEIEPRYCDVIVRRWEEFTGQKAERVSNATA